MGMAVMAVMGTVVMGIGMVAMVIGMAAMVIGMGHGQALVMRIGVVDTGAVIDGAVGGAQASASVSAAITDLAAGTRTMAIIAAATVGATSNAAQPYGWYGCGTGTATDPRLCLRPPISVIQQSPSR